MDDFYRCGRSKADVSRARSANRVPLLVEQLRAQLSETWYEPETAGQLYYQVRNLFRTNQFPFTFESVQQLPPDVSVEEMLKKIEQVSQNPKSTTVDERRSIARGLAWLVWLSEVWYIANPRESLLPT